MTESSSSKKILRAVFEYDDYRAFLADYFNARKKEDLSFSFRSFAKQTGFDAHNFVPLAIAGKRNLSADSIRKIAMGIGLRGRALPFFENLVLLNQAETLAEKDLFFTKIKDIGKKTKFYRLHKNQFFFSEKWYYPIIRECMALSDWNGDYARLAKMVRPAITPREAKRAAKRLLASGIVKRENDTFSLAQEFITLENLPVYIKKKVRRDVLAKGLEIVENIDPADKYIACSTVTMSWDLYEKVRTLFDQTRKEILSLVAQESSVDEVFEVVLQIYPTSKMKERRKVAEGDGNAT